MYTYLIISLFNNKRVFKHDGDPRAFQTVTAYYDMAS